MRPVYLRFSQWIQRGIYIWFVRTFNDRSEVLIHIREFLWCLRNILKSWNLFRLHALLEGWREIVRGRNLGLELDILL